MIMSQYVQERNICNNKKKKRLVTLLTSDDLHQPMFLLHCQLCCFVTEPINIIA